MTHRALPEPMTPRDLDILRGMVEGLTNAEIAEQLVLSPSTVKWYVKQLYSKLDAHSREEAVTHALELGLAAAPFADEPTNSTNIGCPLINPLPLDVTGRYVGNDEKLALLTSLFHQQVRLISIYGRAGSGKTALACRALSLLRRAEQNTLRLSGIVCQSAAGAGLSLDRLFVDLGRLLANKDQAVIDAIARNVELPLAQKIGIVLEKIATRHIIVLLDNLETVQNPDSGELTDPGLQRFIEMALEQSSALTLLITSREPLLLPRSLKTWEHLISLETGLPPQDAITLLRKFDPSGLIGLRDAPAEELRAVAERLGGFPRALEAVAGMLLEDPLLRLADVRRDLDSLAGEISAAVVQQALAHLNDEAMRVLQALAIFDQSVSYEALAYLLTPYLVDSTLRALLGRLIRACFVKANRATQQYTLHPLDQAYCLNRIPAGSMNDASEEPPPFTRAALHQRAANFYREQRLPRSAWRRLADLEPQLNEFKHRVSAGDGDGAARVLLEMDRDHLWEWGYKDLLGQLYPTLESQINDPRLGHQVARRRAWLKFFEAPEEADREFSRLLEEAQRMGFVQEEADALDDLAQTFRRGAKDLRQGVEHHRQALALYRQIGDRRGEAEALGGLGAIFAEIDPEEAIECLRAAAGIQRELGNPNSLSFVLSMLGDAYAALGAPDEAIETMEEALRIARQSSSLGAFGRAYNGLARIYSALGETERGRACVEEGISVTRELSGAPMTVDLMFWVCLTAIHIALAGDVRNGLDLVQDILRDAIDIPPGMARFGKMILSMLLMFKGDIQEAHNLLAPYMVTGYTPTRTGFSPWIGVLLIKTGAVNDAVVFFNGVLEYARRAGTYAPVLYASALPHAGLAVIRRDPMLAASAAELTRQALTVRNWRMDVHRALINLLIEEPGGEILLPIQEILASVPGRK